MIAANLNDRVKCRYKTNAKQKADECYHDSMAFAAFLLRSSLARSPMAFKISSLFSFVISFTSFLIYAGL
jgi:hypothetical protein